MKNIIPFSAAIAALLLIGGSAFAANTTHTVSSGGTAWSTATWTNTTPTAVPGDIANYNTAATALTLTLDVNVTVGEITDTNTGNWTINTNGGNTTSFTLDPTGLTTFSNFKTLDAAILNTSTGTLTVNPNITIANGNLDIGTTGGAGSVVTIGGTISGTGNLLTQLSGNATNTLNLNGNINNTGTVVIGFASGGAYIANPVSGNQQSNGSAITNITAGIGTKVTALALNSGVLNLTSADLSTGATTVNGGTFNLNTGGSLAGNLAVLGGTFNDNSAGVASTATLTVGGLDGTSLFAESSSSAQNFAGLSVTPGLSLITNSTAGNLVFAGGAGGYVRANGGIVQLGNTTSNNKINFTAAPTGTSVIQGGNSTPILNGAVTNISSSTADFVADAAGAVGATTYLAPDTFNVDGNAVVTVNDNMTSSIEIESLKFNGAGGTTMTLSGVNTIDSGGIIIATQQSNTIAGGTLQAGQGQDLWIYSAGTTGHNLIISANIANNTGGGSNGLDYDANGSTLTLSGNNSFTGAVYLMGGGTVNMGSTTALGATTATANLDILNSLTLQNSTNNAITIDRNIVIGAGQTFTIGSATGDTGNITLNGNFSAGDPSSDNSITLSKQGTDTVFVTGSLAGTPDLGIAINGGTLDVTGQLISDSSGWNTSGAATSTGGAAINVHGLGALTDSGDWNFANTANDTLTLTVSGNAVVSEGGRFFIGKAQGAVGIINQNGGTVNAATFFLGGGSESTGDLYNLNGGTLNLTSQNTANTVDTGSVFTANGGTLDFNIPGGGSSLTFTNGEFGTAGELIDSTGGITVNSISTNAINMPILHNPSLTGTDGGLTKTNAGTLTIGGGTYNGATTVAGGTLKEDFTTYANAAVASNGTASNDINSASALVLNGGTLSINGAKGGAGATNVAITGIDGIGSATTATTASASTTITVGSATNLVMGEIVTGTGIQAGTTIAAISGTTVTLSQATTGALAATAIDFYPTATAASGATTITVVGVGSLALGQTITGTGIAAGTTITAISGTTVTLSQATTGAVSGQITNTNTNTVVVASTTGIAVGELVTGTGITSGTYVVAINGSTLLLSQPTTSELLAGSTLSFGANNTALTTTQTFNGTTVSAGGNAIALTNNSTSVTANLGAITRNTGGTLNMPAASSTTIVTTTTPADATGILGPWATVGSTTTLNYATVNGTGQVVAYTGATADATGALSNVTSATTNYKYSGAATLTGNQTGNTLQFTGSAANTSLNGNTLALNGLMNLSTGTLSIGATSTSADPSNSSLTAGSTNELVIQSDGQGVTINDVINDVSTGSGTSLTWAGGSATATLTLNAALEGYTGTTYDDQGIISLANTDTLENSTVYLGGGTLTAASSVSVVELGGLAGNSNFAVPTAITTLEVGNNNQNTTYSGTLSGSTTLVKLGTGSLTLSGANTYTAPTDILGGTLAVNGSTAASTSAPVNVEALTGNTATLTGTGTVGGAVTVTNSFGGTSFFNPGGVGAVGSMTLSSNLTMLAGTQFTFELNSNLGTMDSVFVGGNFTLTGNVALVGADLGSSVIATNTVFTLVQLGATGTFNGTFSGYADGSDITIGSNTFQINYGTLSGYGDDLTLMDVSSATVPEPNQAIMVVLGIAGLVGYRLRRATRVS